MIVVTRDPAGFLDEQLQRSSGDELTYREAGATRRPALAAGYDHSRRTLGLGDGEAVWDRAREAIRLWRAHARAGLAVTPSGAPPREGATVLASRRLGPALVVAPCRVVYTTEDPDRFGFAYGTLPGHPVSGEEAFHVTRHEDGTVTAEVVAFSHPADLLIRAAGPAARRIQKLAMGRYLEGIRAHATGGA